MADGNRVSAELEEQRCLIEQQQVEIQRQRRHIQLQIQITQGIQAELDALKAAIQRVALIGPPKRGNRVNAVVRHAARSRGLETMSSSEQT